MSREECEAKILGKLKEIREIAKDYDDSHEGCLYIVISNEKEHISVFNSSALAEKLNTAIDFTAIN